MTAAADGRRAQGNGTRAAQVGVADSGPLVFDREAFDRAVERGGRATSDDVTILADGTRLDRPDKVRKFAAEMLMQRAGVSEPIDSSVFESDERFAAWLAAFTRAHAATA